MKKPSAGGPLLSQFSEMGSQVSHAQQLAIFTAAMLLGTAVTGMLLIQFPWQERRRQMGTDLDVEKQRAELLLSIQRQKESMDKEEKEALLEGGTPVLTGTISRLAAEAQLAVESVSPKSDQTISPYTQVQIEVTATARLENLLRFLRSVENHRPLLTLNEIEIGDNPAAGAWAVPYGTEQETPLSGEPQDQRVKMLISALQRTGKAP